MKSPVTVPPSLGRLVPTSDVEPGCSLSRRYGQGQNDLSLRTLIFLGVFLKQKPGRVHTKQFTDRVIEYLA